MMSALQRLAAAREREQRRRAALKAWHFTRIVIGYVCASFAAGIVVTICIVATDLQAFSQAVERGTIALAPFLFTFFVLIIAALPALVLIGFAERKRIRNPVYYVVGGALMAVLSDLALLPMEAEAPGSRLPAWLLVSVSFALAGAAAGLVYWAIAGRKSGRKRPHPEAIALAEGGGPASPAG